MKVACESAPQPPSNFIPFGLLHRDALTELAEEVHRLHIQVTQVESVRRGSNKQHVETSEARHLSKRFEREGGTRLKI
jgi:hypothetical protein